MKYLSLFSGIGGFELGIQYALQDISHAKEHEHEAESTASEHRLDSDGETGLGYSNNTNELPELGIKPEDSTNSTSESPQHSASPLCIGYSEIDKYAIQIYERHFQHRNWGDITKLDPATLPDFDLLVGGFPCQAFSIAGKRRGFDDTRGTLFFDIARILREKHPRLFLLENVKGLLSHNNGNTFKTIIATLDELGYDLQWQVLNSKNHGVPQNRERVFIIGHLRGTSRPEVFPIISDGRPADELPRYVANTLTRRYEGAQAVGTYIGEGELDAQETKPSGQSVLEERTESDNSNSRGRATHPASIRRLTPTECERLQGFPDGWTEGVSDTQRYKCLGNAVTVNVIRDIIAHLL